MLLNAGKTGGLDQNSGVADVREPSSSTAQVEVKPKLTVTKARAFCLEWFKTNDYDTSSLEDTMIPSILNFGLKCLGMDPDLTRDIAAKKNQIDQINLLVEALKEEDS